MTLLLLVGAAAAAPRAAEAPVAAPAADPAWPAGARGRIRAVSPTDATYGRAPSVVGLVCTATAEPLVQNGAGWLAGPLRCEDGRELFFFQVALDRVGGPTAPADDRTRPAEEPVRKADGRLANGLVPAGRVVRIVALAATDGYYRERSTLVGASCTVVETPLRASGDGWYAGRLFCADGVERQFFQVAVAPD